MKPRGIAVIKGHAYGNDFLLAPEAEVEGWDVGVLARAMCSRHEGIGADGLMIYAFGASNPDLSLVGGRDSVLRRTRHPV